MQLAPLGCEAERREEMRNSSVATRIWSWRRFSLKETIGRSLKHPALLGSHTSDFDGCLVGHLTDQVLGCLPFPCQQSSEYSLSSLSKAVPQNFQMSNPPSILELVDLAEHAECSSVASFVTGTSRLLEPDRPTGCRGERVARRARESEDGVVS